MWLFFSQYTTGEDGKTVIGNEYWRFVFNLGKRSKRRLIGRIKANNRRHRSTDGGLHISWR